MKIPIARPSLTEDEIQIFLPLFHGMKDSEQNYIIEKIKEIL